VQQELTNVFRCYGLPDQMLMDNGSPWGDDAHSKLTVLTVWLIRLGIRVTHCRPYHPQTQGKDERFHRSLEFEVLRWNRFHDLNHCQRYFDEWRDIYNLERPHESLGMQVPADRYRPSNRPFPRLLAQIEYPSTDLVRSVDGYGRISFRGQRVRVSRALSGYRVALRPTNTDGQWQIFFCQQRITSVDLRVSK
jgi:Integrase core domain